MNLQKLREGVIQWLIKLRDMAINGFVFAVVLIAVILAVATIWGPYFDNPPITISSKNEKDLGTLCPGDSYMIVNEVTISEELLATYYATVLDEMGLENIVGTQVIYPGFQHPFVGTFSQEFLWTVPNLPEGKFVRSFGARATDGEEKSVFVTHTFTIGDEEICHEGS